jgi:hypothetical protein
MIKRRTESDTIDGLKVVTTQYSLQEGLQLQSVLAKLVLPVLAKLPDGVSLGTLGALDLKMIGGSLQAAADQLNEHELWALVCRVLRSTQVAPPGGKAIELNSADKIEAAIGELPTLYKILWFVLVVNFRTTFSAVSSAPPSETATESAAAATTASP